MPRNQFEEEWSGVAIFLAPKSIYQPVKEKKNSLFLFIPSLLKQRKLLVNIILAALLTTLISILSSYFLQVIIDTYIPNNMQSTLAIIALGLLIFYIFRQFLLTHKIFVGDFRSASIN